MKKVTASTGPWAAIAAGIALGVPAVVGGFNTLINGDQRPLSPAETYDRDFEFCMYDTGYELENPIYSDASRKRQIGTDYIGALVVTNNDVTIVPGPPDQTDPSLNFRFTVVEGVRTLVPDDEYTARMVTKQGC